MKIDILVEEIGIAIYENVFFYFYFLNVHISLIMYIMYLKPLVHTENIAMEGTVSQIVHTCSHLLFIKCRKNILKNNQKGTRIFFT